MIPTRVRYQILFLNRMPSQPWYLIPTMVLLLLGFSLPAWAQESTQTHWAQAKSLLTRGAYREALQELEIILTLDPNDPWASAYRSLCEKRLRAGPQFRKLSPPELAALQEALRREQEAQARAAAQAKALEREVKQEQARWDAELARLQREAIRDQKAKHRQARLEQAHARRIAQQLRKLPRKPKAPPVKPPPIPEVPRPPPPVELAPVTVPTKAPELPVPERPIPQPPVPERPPIVGVPTPLPAAPPPVRPGAVQIFADQLSMSPDRHLANASGDVKIVFDDGILTADHVTLFTDTQDAYAQGRVRLERGPDVFRGEMVHYNFNTKKGRFLEGTAFREPWYEHGRIIEHIAEGVLRVKPGYLTSCEFEPPHFRLQGRTNTVFAADKIARGRNVLLFVEETPLIYLPWLTVADRQSPFFFIPGKKKPWEQFALMGYRYEWPAGHRGSLRLDWRRAFGWATGIDHRFETERLGKGLLKLYYNEEQNRRRPRSDLPKGADVNRYRVLFRHNWQSLPDTTMVTDIQEFSDVDFRRELLFREEFVEEDAPESFVSLVTSDPHFTLSLLAKKRMNRFQTVTESFPDATIDIKPQRVGESQLYVESRTNFANLQAKTAHSDDDTAAVRLDWFQQLSYALNLFRPILVTPKAGIRQTYYTRGKDQQETARDVFSGQFNMGADASLKLFRIFPVTTNALGLDLNWLRHVLTPTVGYSYIHQPTVPNDLLNFATASSPTNQLSFGLENKLQTKRPATTGKPQSVDLARFLVSLPYTFHGSGTS